MTSVRPLVLTIGFAVSLVACASAGPTELSQQPPVIETNATPRLSSGDFDTTRERIREALEARGLTIFAEVDHAAGARAASLALPENTVFIFGNPNIGTPLMLANPVLGLDLPLKVSVFVEGNEVYVQASDIRAIVARARISEPAAVVDRIESALASIVQEAVSK